ncbi:MAG: hypothetical protein Q9169_008637, partial [Polycauliona sp. 2 TL-2023]
MHGKQRRKLELAQREYEETSEANCKALAGDLLVQWPSRELTLKGLPDRPLLEVREAIALVRPEWERLVDNHQLSEHLVAVQTLLDRCGPPHPFDKKVEEDIRDWYPSWKLKNAQPLLTDLLYRPLKEVPAIDGISPPGLRPAQAQPRSKLDGVICTDHVILPGTTPSVGSIHARLNPRSELEDIISHFSQSQDRVRSAYGQDLKQSLVALRQEAKTTVNNIPSTLRVDTRVLNE